MNTCAGRKTAANAHAPRELRRSRDPRDDVAAEFTALVQQMSAKLVRFVARQVGEQAAEDVVADVFEVVWRRWDSVPPDGSARRAWVYETAKRTMKGWWARQTRSRDLLTRLRLPAGDCAPAVDEDIIDRTWVEQALIGLPPDQAAVVRCLVLEGLGPAQAATRLRISVSAVAGRARRARVNLRRQLESWRVEDQVASREPVLIR